jgi:hypothetical protein
MEIKPVIFTTLDEESDLIISDVFNCLPAEIRHFHSHIPISMLRDTDLSKTISDSIDNVRHLRGNDKIKMRHETTGQFECDIFYLARKPDLKTIERVASLFAVKFKELNIENYDEIFFSLMEIKNRIPVKYYVLSNNDSHKYMVGDEELLQKVKYFFLFFLVSELYENEKVEKTLKSFYFDANNPQKTFKSIAIEIDGLPLFLLREYYEFLLKEYYVRSLVEIQNEANPDPMLNKIRLVSSLTVEELKLPAKPNNAMNLSFFNTKKKRKINIEKFLNISKGNFDIYDKKCHEYSKKQRKEFEKYLDERIPTELINLNHDVLKGVISITQKRKLINKLIFLNTGVPHLIDEKQKEIIWCNLFKYLSKPLTSNHPNWIIISILGGILVLPEIINNYIPLPMKIILKSNLLPAIFMIAYILFSIYSLRNVRSRLKGFYNTNLQKIENYYRMSFKSFIKYLEIYILKRIVGKLEKTDRILAHNQAFLFAYYLFNYQGSRNYQTIKENLMTNLNCKNNLNVDFRNRLKIELIRIIEHAPNIKENIEEIINNTDSLESCIKLIEVIEHKLNNSKVSNLLEKYKKIDGEKDIFDIIQTDASKTELDLTEQQVLGAFNEIYLNKIIRDHIDQHSSFENILANIAQRNKYDPKRSIEKLLEKDNQMYYLCTSNKTIDIPHKILFTNQIDNNPKYTEYKNPLYVICGLLHIYDLKLD